MNIKVKCILFTGVFVTTLIFVGRPVNTPVIPSIDYTKKILSVLEKPKIVVVEEPITKKEEPIKYTIIATGYDNDEACTGKKKPEDRGKTASGVLASRGTVAVPRDIPFGTKFYIEGIEQYTGINTYVAQDLGGAIKRIDATTIKIDVWFPTHKEAMDFGVKTFTGYIVE